MIWSFLFDGDPTVITWADGAVSSDDETVDGFLRLAAAREWVEAPPLPRTIAPGFDDPVSAWVTVYAVLSELADLGVVDEIVWPDDPTPRGESGSGVDGGPDEDVDEAIVAGGPGSGPRPGVQNPWYKRGSKKGAAIPGVVGDFVSTTAEASRLATQDMVEAVRELKRNALTWAAEQGDSPDLESMPRAYAEFLVPGAPRELGYLIDENPRVAAAAKAKITQKANRAWKNLGVTGTIDPQAPPLIRAAIEKVAKEPKIANAAARFGKVPRVVFVAPGANKFEGAHSSQMGTIAMSANASTLEAVREQAMLEGTPSEVPPFGRNVVGGASYEATFRHEFGHHVEHQLRLRSPQAFTMIREAIGGLKNQDLLSVSGYATGMFGLGTVTRESLMRERFAELFGAVAHPDYSRGLFPTALQPVLAMMEGLVS